MGCDIHAIIEKKGKRSTWVNRGEPKLDRNYALFAILGNVRNYNDNPFIAENRGVPEDCSDAFEWWSKGMGNDGHSHSWVSLEEMKEFKSEPHEYYDRLAWGNLIWQMELIGEDTRLVFFFDN